MFLAVVCLSMSFLFPIWKIILIAPQYPDGVEMHIWINKIGGKSVSTLQNINILNHYVGMKRIEPESIPELKYLPVIVGILLTLGIIALLFDKSWMYLSWATLMIILAIIGFYDFYLWEYNYGHNLDPTAPLKFEGASFQPPLLGTKVILNFIATSLPHIGGYFFGLAIILGLASWRLKARKLKK